MGDWLGGNQETPEISAGERESQAAQRRNLDAQTAQIQKVSELRDRYMPSSLNILGFDEAGGDRRAGVTEALSEQFLSSILGDDFKDPFVERQISDERTLLANQMFRQGGEGFGSSTPGMQAQQRFMEGAIGMRTQARDRERGNLQNLLRGEAGRIGSLQSLLTGGLGVGQAFGQAAQGEAGMGRTFLGQRQLEANVGMSNEQARATTLSGLFQGVGALGGAVMGGMGGAPAAAGGAGAGAGSTASILGPWNTAPGGRTGWNI